MAPPPGVLDVRAPAGATVQVGAQRVRVETDNPVRFVGIGAPPYTVHMDRGDERTTILEVPGPTLDFVTLGGESAVRGTLIPLAIRPTIAGLEAVAALSGDQVFQGRRTPTGFEIRLPEGVPARLVGLWRPGGRATALGLRLLPDPRRSLGVQALAPTVPLDAETRVRLESAPTGYLSVELTLEGLRTGLVLGGGVAARQEGVAVARPSALAGAGLWLEATARSPGAAAPDRVAGAHVQLATAEASLAWAPEAQVQPRPATEEPAPALGVADRTLRWAPGDATYAEIELLADDGCAPTRTWRVFAPAAPGRLTLPRIEDDPLGRPLLTGRVTLHGLAGVAWEAWVRGEAPSASRWPRAGAAWRQGEAGRWRGGEEACAADARQGAYTFVPEAACGAAQPLDVVVDRCGRVLPLDGDVGLCQARLPAALDDLRVADGALVPDGGAAMLAPAALSGDWYRVEVWRELRTLAPDGGPGTTLEDRVRIDAGDAVDGPYARMAPTGHLQIATRRLQVDARLTAFDGQRVALALPPDGCALVPGAEARLDGEALTVTLWRPQGPTQGALYEVQLGRR
ncbi:MAG: hypothetical protein H6706_31220 [Myxococcales bacterium]|nr:hypothetical protein [Myxococcales bacterium]